MDILLEAFAKMPKFNLVVAGTGTQEEKYRQLASENVFFTGFLNRENLVSVLKQAKAVIVPSQWYETFGMVIAEAYAAHKPVIAGEIGNVSMLVNEYSTGLKFRYDSTEDLVATVKTFENTDTTQWGENSFKIYESVLSPESNYQQLIRIYKTIRY